MSNRLKGKVAAVTGSGQGRPSYRYWFGKEGAKVATNNRNLIPLLRSVIR
jgi:hypothetical protein